MIPSSDFERAVGFYSTILEIEMPRMVGPSGNDLAFFKGPQEDGVGGGVASDPNRKPGADGPIVYLNSEGVMDDILGRVEGAGGRSLRPR